MKHAVKLVIRGGELLKKYILIGANNKEYKIEYYSISKKSQIELSKSLDKYFQIIRLEWKVLV